MGRRVVWLAAGVVLVLALGVGSASGRSLATTTVTVEVIGQGTVTSSPAGISCVRPATCSFGFTGTGTIVLTPSNTASGWTFDTWACSGPDVVFADSCQITPVLVDSNHNVTATFTFSQSTAVGQVAVSAVGLGRVTSTPAGLSCGDGKETCYLAFSGGATLRANDSASGWAFDHWEDVDANTGVISNPCDGSTADTCVVPAGENHVVTAVFAGPPTSTRTLSVSTNDSTTTGGKGVVRATQVECGTPTGSDCSWTVLTGSTLTLLELPGAASVFSSWSGDCTDTDVSCTVVMNGDRSANASGTRRSRPPPT